MFALVLVFLQWDLVTAPSFAGFDNVRLLANEGRFWRAVGNTFVFLSIHVSLQIVTALALALALNRQLVLRSFWRAAFRPQALKHSRVRAAAPSPADRGSRA